MSDTQTTTAPAAVAPDAAMLDARLIPVGLIDRDPAQPRRHFHVDTLEALADSIKLHGVIQPVEVEATPDGRYRLHHGERRWRAATLAGLEAIPAIVAPARAADETLLRALIENLHRQDLDPIEEALTFRRLMDEMGWTRMRIARETGRSQATVTGRLTWLQVEPEIQQFVALDLLPRDSRLAEALAALPPQVRVPLARKLVARAVGLKGSLAACTRAAEEIAAHGEAVERGRQAHAKTAAAVAHGYGANGASPSAIPMLGYAGLNSHGRGLNGHGLNGHGAAPVVTVGIEAAATAMCRACHIRPPGHVIPAWEIVEREAAATCAACVKRDGPAVPEVCRNCPGVAMVRRLVGAVGEGGRDE